VNDRERIAWLHRRAGFGLAPGELDQLVALGPAQVLDRLVEPDAHGVAVAPDPWSGLALPLSSEETRKDGGRAIVAWLDHLARTPRPLEDWMAWFWHGHLVSSLLEVKRPALMVGQVRTYRRLGLGSFGELVRAMAIDPAMLVYLDGDSSTGDNPNENFGRELMELFTLGFGIYTEPDVKAAARALTGWRIDRATGAARFVPRRHDPTPQKLLGATGVSDLDGVVAAVTQHEACAPFVAGRLAAAILGPGVDAHLVSELAGGFRASGLQIRPLVRSILEAGLDGASTELVTAPVPWLVAAERATAVTLPGSARLPALQAAGQLPMVPPNVGGWPGGSAWLATSTVVARSQLAVVLATQSRADGAARSAAANGDLDALADALGRPAGFSTATSYALGQVAPGPDLLANALVSPEVVLA
jgi:uncharacterized protein (DUF1800 family)